MKNKIPLKIRLVILPMIPLLAFLSVSISQFRTNLNDLRIIDNQEHNILYITDASRLILMLQRERGISATYINSGDKKTEVDKNREAVNLELDSIEAVFKRSSFYSDSADSVGKLKNDIEQIRSSVDHNTISFSTVMEDYSKIITKLFDMNGIASKEETTGGVGKLLSSINVLQDAQEAAGRFRGYSSSIIASDTGIDDELFLSVLRDFNAIRLNLSSRGVILSDNSSAMREKLLKSPEWIETEKTMRILSFRYGSGGFGLDQGDFWTFSTAVVDGIHAIIDAEINNTVLRNSELKKKIQNAYIEQLIVLIGAFAAVIIFSTLIIISISRRLGKVTGRLSDMSSGSSDLTLSIPVAVNDDIGKLVTNFNKYVGSLKLILQQVQQSAEGLTGIGQDLTKQIDETGKAKNLISENLENVQENVEVQVYRMNNLSSGIGVFNDSITELTDAIETQAAAVTESSASIEQMIANIKMVTRNLDNTTNLINELDKESRRGGELIDQVAREIDQVSEQSVALQEANELIAGIAEQTNLLAMNAAIEAAHAGEAGKGFSVVADEIRRLAETSAEQSGMISQNIKTILSSIERVVGSAGSTEKSFSAIIEKIIDVSSLQEAIRGAMTEQNYGSSEILSALASLNNNSHQVSEAGSRMTDTGSEMTAEIHQVRETTDSLHKSTEVMSRSISQIDEVINRIAVIVRQNEDYVNGLNEKTGRFVLD